MKVMLHSVPHESQRYPTVGDWIFRNDTLFVAVSDMDNPDYEFLVAIHEAIEAWLCAKRGVDEKDITAFDIQFEKEREAGLHPEDAEPGDHPMAPYRKEHFFATSIERIIAAELGVDWAEYDRTVMSL